MARCILDNKKICNHCGTCDDRCQLFPEKPCTNCFRCLDEQMEGEYAEIKISDVFMETDASAFMPSGYTIEIPHENEKIITVYHAVCPTNIRGRYKK